MTEHKPGDPADKGADQFVSHRAGYGDDKLTWLIDFLRRNQRATLQSGEGALLLAEIDRQRAAATDSADHYADARNEIDRLTRTLAADVQWLRQMLADYRIPYDDHQVGRRIALNVFIHSLRQRAERAERILAALREPSVNIWEAAVFALDADEDMKIAIRAAVEAAEQEVGRE